MKGSVITVQLPYMGEIFHILLINFAVLVLRLNKPGQINRQSLRLQYVVHRAKIHREIRFFDAAYLGNVKLLHLTFCSNQPSRLKQNEQR